MKTQWSDNEFELSLLESEGAHCMTKNFLRHFDQFVVLNIIIVLTAFEVETLFRLSEEI